MKGIKHLIVQSARIRYDMEFARNITVLKGDSATGKTTLVDMIAEYERNGTDTGINISCNCPCRVVAGNSWQEQLKNIHESLVFIDEGNRFIVSEEFACAIKETDNYYVIVTRENLYNLPYSVDEIYGIRNAGKYSFQEVIYNQMYRIYGDYKIIENKRINKLIVEDSNSGFDFFTHMAKTNDIECISANGAGNIFGIIQNFDNNDTVTIAADGAAFGAHMEKVYKLLAKNKNIKLYLPESFEWIILSSKIFNDKEIKNILNNPSDYIDSERFFSWERFFTYLLINKTADTYLKYSKSKLNPSFLQGKNYNQILEVLPDVVKK